MRLRTLSLGFVVTLATSVARAETDVPVLLELHECNGLDEAELRRIVAAELGAAAAEQGGPSVTKVSVSCEGPKATLRVEDPLSRKAVQRSINLGKADTRARARLVAIASTELVLASWAELETNPKPQVEPEGPPPSPEAQEAARGIARDRMPGYEPRKRHWYDSETPADRGLHLLVVGSERSFLNYDGMLWGGGLRLGDEPFRFVAWSVDALFEKGSIALDTGRVDVTSVTGGGRLLAYVRVGHFYGGMGAGLRVGFASTTGSSSLALWGWPLGCAALSVHVGTSLLIELSGEASYVILPVGGESTPGTLRGGWFSGQLGLGWMFPAAK